MLMVALRNSQDERACQHLAGGFALTPEEREKRMLRSDATLQEEAAAIGGLDTQASSFKSNARKFCQRKQIRLRVAGIHHFGHQAGSALWVADLETVAPDLLMLYALAAQVGEAELEFVGVHQTPRVDRPVSPAPVNRLF